jgi:hypothetical protein
MDRHELAVFHTPMTDKPTPETLDPCEDQITRLAAFIMAHVPGEPSRSEGAVDCAIRIMSAHSAKPVDDGLVERLREKARSSADILRQMAESKSLRQSGNPERRTDLYMSPPPEQQIEWQAADEIERLRAALALTAAALRAKETPDATD